ncbi:MAG: molecular chaperone HtpG [Planctomycetes bacterium]|nr:molecular chaperone HtpG [Planctomycetota bacterium]
MQTETRPFQAEVQELLGLVIHSLYKHEEIFLRELVSNASDACDKLRFEALTNPALAVKEDELAVRIEVDPAARTLTVEDDGIGMTHDELAENLGTIARSGTKAFLRELRDKAGAGGVPSLIGQFGVGFYSSFIVADKVVVESRRAGADAAWRWTSEGKGEYTIEPCELSQRGTRVTLHLRWRSNDEDGDAHGQDFTNESTLRAIVKKYSDFVAFPIRMEVERWEPAEGGKPGDGRMVRKVETLNSMRPLWTRAKDEITADEHAEFYRHLAHDWEAPLETIHFKAEGTLEYTALLYVPARRPMDLFSSNASKSELALYVKRVLIVPDCHDLLPPWLRFVRGLVDAPDLPLNVSRDVLQQNAQVRQIQKRLVKRVCESLAQMLEKDRARYQGFWTNFGMLIKEGIYAGGDDDQRLSKIALFPSTHGEEPVTLGEYGKRMKAGQEAIWYLAGEDRRSLEGSPHLEAFQKRGEEVLFFVDPVDEWLLERFREFDGKPLRAIDREGAHVESASEKEARETLEREHREVLGAIERELAAHVKGVRFSTRLSESPAALVSDANAMGPNMERLMRAANQEVEPQKRVLELNPDHALFKKLGRLRAEKGEASSDFQDHVALLHGQALLAEGSPLPEPGRFARLVAKLLA